MSEEERAMEIEQRDIEDFAKYIRGEFENKEQMVILVKENQEQ